MTDLTAACIWCKSPLKGHATTQFKDLTTFVASCPKCGDYVLQPDLVPRVDEFSDDERYQVHTFLADFWAAAEEAYELDYHFVRSQLLAD